MRVSFTDTFTHTILCTTQWARATPYSVIQFLAWEQMARVFKVSTVE